jgi:hypothetical protein
MNIFNSLIVLASITLAAIGSAYVIPAWMGKVYIANFVLCFFGFEIWMTYGWVNGDSEQARTGDLIDPLLNAIVMSAGDALIGLAQVAVVKGVLGNDAFRRWNWRALGLMLALGLLQNFLVTYILRAKIKVGQVAWAPLMPYQGPNVVQIQEGWLLQPFLFYAILIQGSHSILDIPLETTFIQT